MSTHSHDVHAEHAHAEPPRYAAGELFKFALVIVGILLTSWLLASSFGPTDLQEWLRWLMGAFFLVFGAFKLIGYRTFADTFAGYDLVAQRLKAYAYVYPFIELGLAALYLFDVAPTFRDTSPSW